MDPVSLNDNNGSNGNSQVTRVLKVTGVLVFISTFMVILLGFSLNKIHNENKELNSFLSLVENLQTDFEKSLLLYTENTKDDIEFVQSVRPETELNYVEFISEVEELANQLSLNIELESIDSREKKQNIDSNTLHYEISFYGSENDLIKFLRGLEELPPYIRVDNVDFSTLNSINNEKSPPNIRLNITLYVK